MAYDSDVVWYGRVLCRRVDFLRQVIIIFPFVTLERCKFGLKTDVCGIKY